jgi:hypothetical protein
MSPLCGQILLLSYRRFITACIALVVFPCDAYFVTGFSAFDGELKKWVF